MEPPLYYWKWERPAWKPQTHWSLPLIIFQKSWTLRQSEAVSSLQGEGGGERRSVDLLFPDVCNSEICWRISQSNTGQHQGWAEQDGERKPQEQGNVLQSRGLVTSGTGDRPFPTAVQAQKRVERFVLN